MTPPVAFCWFTFAGDAECLVESVKSVRRAYGPRIPVCVYDDAAAPIPSCTLQSIKPTLYERTTWPRRGNLNGPVCVRGILDALSRAARACGTTWVSKIDSDVILVRPWLIADTRWAYQGLSWGLQHLAAGANNYMRQDLPERILRRLAGRPGFFRPEDANCPEDNTIACLATLEAPGGVLIHDSANQSPEPRIGAGWFYDVRRTFDQAAHYSLVTFGNRFSIPNVDPDTAQSRAIVASTMLQFNAYLDSAQI